MRPEITNGRPEIANQPKLRIERGTGRYNRSITGKRAAKTSQQKRKMTKHTKTHDTNGAKEHDIDGKRRYDTGGTSDVGYNIVIPIWTVTLSLILALSLQGCQYTTWTGKAMSASDGDTITVMHNGKAEKVRLYGIDCPEKRQTYGKKAKQFTSKMTIDKTVEVKPVATDRYGRTIAWIYIDGKCLNKELLKAGLAWHYKRYSHEKCLAELETKARRKKMGLWNNPHSIPPWDYRHGTGNAGKRGNRK